MELSQSRGKYCEGAIALGIQGLIDTGVIQRKSEADDSYGRLTSTPADLITGWKCRLSRDYSIYARQQRGKGGREAFVVVGELTTTVMQRGDMLIIDAITYEITEAEIKRTPTANHHWLLRVERIL